MEDLILRSMYCDYLHFTARETKALENEMLFQLSQTLGSNPYLPDSKYVLLHFYSQLHVFGRGLVKAK